MQVKDLTIEQFGKLMNTDAGRAIIEGKYDSVWFEPYSDIDGTKKLCIDGRFSINTEIPENVLKLLDK